jgi:uncharacterized protein
VQALTGLQWWRLTSVPRVSDLPDPGRWMSASVTAALVSAHGELLASGDAGVVAVAWVRPPDSADVIFLAGGRPEFPPGRRGTRSPGADNAVLFPPGAAAEPVPPEVLDRWWEGATTWMRCLATHDVEAPATSAAPIPGADLPAGLDDYAIHLAMPFVWLVVAVPIGRDALDAEIDQLNARLTLVRKRESSEAHRVELERGQRRVRELTRARATGLWRVHVLAGGGSVAGARQNAAVLCVAAEPENAGHLMFPGEGSGDFAEVWGQVENGPDQAASPFLAGTDLVSVLMRPPAREMPGIRTIAPYRFDVTPLRSDAAGIPLGTVLDESLRPAGTMTVSYETLNRHGFICGATGSGKSQTARTILQALSTGRRPIPWLVIEPAKAEYNRMLSRIGRGGEVLAIRPGDLGAPPVSVNPLEPEPGFPLQSHADFVRALFLAAFEADEPFPQVLSHALTECYAAAGWDLVTGELRDPIKPKLRLDEPDCPARQRYPTLRELQATARRVVDEIGYGPEIAANVRGFIDVRIGSLRLGTPGRFFEGGHPLDVGELLRHNVVVELETITNDQDKAFFIGTLLIRLVEHLRVNQHGRSAEELRHVLLIEEAHRLLKNTAYGPAAAAVELFSSLLAEVRAYGEGVLVVEQTPSKIVPDVLKNTALKIMHRLPARDDRDAVGATMNLSELNSQNVVTFSPGQAAVSMDGDDRPLLLQMPLVEEAPGEGLPVPPLRDRRSILCGPSCRETPCILSEIAHAARVSEDPSVVVWVEAVAASMILGRPAPVPRPTATEPWPSDGRGRNCVLSTLVERAVDARRVQLAQWVDPDDFAVRLRELLLSGITGVPASPDDARRWQAGAYRFRQVYVQVRSWVHGQGDAPGAVELSHVVRGWRELALYLEGQTPAELFEQLRAHPAYAEGSDRVVLGDIQISGFRRAVHALAGRVDPAGVRQALQHTCRIDSGDKVLQAVSRLFISRRDAVGG